MRLINAIKKINGSIALMRGIVFVYLFVDGSEETQNGVEQCYGFCEVSKSQHLARHYVSVESYHKCHTVATTIIKMTCTHIKNAQK